MTYDELLEYCQNIGFEMSNPTLVDISDFLNDISLVLDIDSVSNLYYVIHHDNAQ